MVLNPFRWLFFLFPVRKYNAALCATFGRNGVRENLQAGMICQDPTAKKRRIPQSYGPCRWVISHRFRPALRPRPAASRQVGRRQVAYWQVAYWQVPLPRGGRWDTAFTALVFRAGPRQIRPARSGFASGAFRRFAGAVEKSAGDALARRDHVMARHPLQSIGVSCRALLVNCQVCGRPAPATWSKRASAPTRSEPAHRNLIQETSCPAPSPAPRSSA